MVNIAMFMFVAQVWPTISMYSSTVSTVGWVSGASGCPQSLCLLHRCFLLHFIKTVLFCTFPQRTTIAQRSSMDICTVSYWKHMHVIAVKVC